MRSLLWLIGLIMIFGWGLGFFIWAAPSFIHLFLVIGVIMIVMNFFGNKRARV